MYEIIKNMIDDAETNKDCNILSYVKDLLYKLAGTFNCPSNWRNIGERLAKEYDPDSWVYEELKLWEYIEE